MTGGEGADLFRLHEGGGLDTVTDFNGLAGDRIDVDPDSLLDQVGVSVGADGTTLTLADGSSILLEGVTDFNAEEWLV